MDGDYIPDLETRKKNPYEYFPYFDDDVEDHDPKYKTAADRHSLMFPERPRVRRNWYYIGDDFPTGFDEYFTPGNVQYPVLVKNRNDPIDDPKVIPNLAIRKKNRLEYFPDFKNMSKEEFDSAVKEHAKLWPNRPKILRARPVAASLPEEDILIYEGNPYPVLVTPQ